MYNINIEVHLSNHCCHRKAVSIKYSKCVSVALVIQYVKNVHLIILPFVACWSYHIIQHYFINSTIFREKS